MKSISVEEMLAQIDEVLEESEPSTDTGVVAAPTGPTISIPPTQLEQHFALDHSDANEFRPLPATESETVRYTPLPSQPNPFSPENPEVEQRYQNTVERHIEAYGEPPNPLQSQMLRTHAIQDVRIEQQTMRDFHRRQLQEHSENRAAQPLIEEYELAGSDTPVRRFLGVEIPQNQHLKSVSLNVSNSTASVNFLNFHAKKAKPMKPIVNELDNAHSRISPKNFVSTAFSFFLTSRANCDLIVKVSIENPYKKGDSHDH